MTLDEALSQAGLIILHGPVLGSCRIVSSLAPKGDEMSEMEERARELQSEARKWCALLCAPDVQCKCQDRATSVLRSERRLAFERAAEIARAHCPDHKANFIYEEIASAILAAPITKDLPEALGHALQADLAQIAKLFHSKLITLIIRSPDIEGSNIKGNLVLSNDDPVQVQKALAEHILAYAKRVAEGSISGGVRKPPAAPRPPMGRNPRSSED